MSERIHWNTPLIYGNYIPPPPRKLWSADSPTEQLYRNKWTKYKNSIGDKDRCSEFYRDFSPHFIDFTDIPDVHEDYFDNGEEERLSTPRTFKTRPRLDVENNNLFEEFETCARSTIKINHNYERQETQDSSQLPETFQPISVVLSPLKDTIFPTIKENDEKTDIETSELCDKRVLKNDVKLQRPINKKNEKKTLTIIEPFTFEEREKFRQEHDQSRRERDSIGKQLRKGFRANPLPNYLKCGEKINATAKICKETNDAVNKVSDAIEIWKKQAFEPIYPKRLPIASKEPKLLTATRALERQRFDNELKEKERERQALQKKEEAARKKREKEEIVKLRRRLVHKAQPVRKYKPGVPKVTKLSDSRAQIPCGRRRNV